MKKEIDQILLKISSQADYPPQSSYNFDSPEEYTRYRQNITLLKDEHLIEPKITNPNFFHITSLGVKVIKEGGWENYQSRKESKEEKRQRKEELDLKISEFQVRTKWLPYWISAISLIISILAFTRSCDSPDSLKDPEIAQTKAVEPSS